MPSYDNLQLKIGGCEGEECLDNVGTHRGYIQGLPGYIHIIANIATHSIHNLLKPSGQGCRLVGDAWQL